MVNYDAAEPDINWWWPSSKEDVQVSWGCVVWWIAKEEAADIYSSDQRLTIWKNKEIIPM
jgi:hypothetical protein